MKNVNKAPPFGREAFFKIETNYSYLLTFKTF